MCNDGLTVLSLFDGMSCGAIALREAGIKVKQYYASEVDTYAIAQTQHNFPKPYSWEVLPMFGSLICLQ